MWQIEIILKSMALGWIITRFQPLQLLIEAIYELFRKYLIVQLLMIGMTCSKCCTFWASLVIFQNIWLAISSSFLMVLYEKTLGKWEKEISF